MISTIILAAVLAAAPAQHDQAELERTLLLLDQLDAFAVEVEYRDQLLSDVLADLNQRLPVAVQADWEALERIDVHDDDVITLRVRPSSALTVLAGISFLLGDEFEHPTFEAHGGQIVLTTLKGSTSMRLTGVYDVRDLLANAALVQRLRREAPPSTLDAESPEEPPAEKQPADVENEPVAPDAGAQDLPPRRELPEVVNEEPAGPRQLTPGEELMLLITEHIDPEAWMNFGGDRARISELDGVILVTASATTHRNFRNALERLRHANPSSLAIEAALVDLPRASFERLRRQFGSAAASSLAVAVKNDPTAALLWSSSAAVALGATLDIDSSAENAAIHIVLRPAINQTTGMINVEVDASTQSAGDGRGVKTTLALTTDQRNALVELPAAKPGDTVRFLVLTAHRQ